MSANELAERCAASAWVECTPEFGTVRYRSSVGFTDRIIASTDLFTYPLLVLPLDREMARTEYLVLASPVVTIDADGETYPSGSLTIPVQPIRIAWLGPLDAPTWLPFGSTPAPELGELDRFDALAVMAPQAADFCVHVLRAPQYEGSSDIANVIPVPVPPPPTLLLNWDTTPRRALNQYPVLTITGGAWKYVLTMDAASADWPAQQRHFALSFSPSRIHFEGEALRLYDSTGVAILDVPITAPAGAQISITHDFAAEETTISGAATGNGTHAWSGPANWPTDRALMLGGLDGDTTAFPVLGTISDILDPSDDSTIYPLTYAAQNISVPAAFFPGAFATSRPRFTIRLNDALPPPGYVRIFTFYDTPETILFVANVAGALQVRIESSSYRLVVPVVASVGVDLTFELDLSSSPYTLTLSGFDAGNGTYPIDMSGGFTWPVNVTVDARNEGTAIEFLGDIYDAS